MCSNSTVGSAISSVLWPKVEPSGELPQLPRTQRALGAFYTPSVAASFMAAWALRGDSERAIEPSMGDGQFLRALGLHAERVGHRGVELWGVELDQVAYRETVGGGIVAPERAILGDFLEVEPFPVDVAIGNPPYVRLRHLPRVEADRARLIGSQELGSQIDPAGSVWLPFVTHATSFLKNGGRLAFVLPLELTYVRYAKPLWRFLGARFESLRVVRVHERLFPDLLQDVVILLADGRGSMTSTVQYDCFERRSDLLDGHPSITAQIDLGRILGDERPFMEALLARDLCDLLGGRLSEIASPLREKVTWNIGYVSGDKAFFHPRPEAITEFALSKHSLTPAISSGRLATKHGLMTAGIPRGATQQLFLPDSDALTLGVGERRYIRHGEAAGVQHRYKCRIRDPWYVTPGVRAPDLVMPVFSDRPILLVNDGRFAVSNSMLAGYLRADSAESIAAAWYTSLTMLQIELRVHSLGGGVLVMVPSEAGAIRTVERGSIEALAEIDGDLRCGAFDQAYERGDRSTLQGLYRLTSQEIELLRDGIDSLRRWRRSGRGPRSTPRERSRSS